MSNYFNAEGEPMLTAAAARTEAEIDAMSADDFYDYMGESYSHVGEDYYYDHPEDCPHEDRTYLGSGEVRCDQCEGIIGTWERGEDGWPVEI